MSLLLIGLVGALFIIGEGQKCQNEYRYVMTIKYGRKARVNPDREVYFPEDVVRFKCPAGYHFQSPYYRAHQEMWIQCLKGHHWLENWPICRGPLENVTCENEYYNAERHGRHWQNQTVNEFHALYSPRRSHYRYGETLRFKCPPYSKIYRTSGLTVMTTRCLENTKWSKEWPMCKGRTCQSLYVKNGEFNDKHKKLSVGITLHIKCDPGYYLWGPNKTTCLSNLAWSGAPAECVTLREFKSNCEKDNKVMRYSDHPWCFQYERTLTPSNHYKIAVGISVPMAIGFIIFIVTASLYVKHQRIKMARERASYIRQEHRHNCLLKSLPSYDEAIKSIPSTPPPTFEETFSAAADNTEDHQLLAAQDRDYFTEAIVELPPQYSEDVPYSDLDLPPQYSEIAFTQTSALSQENMELLPVSELRTQEGNEGQSSQGGTEFESYSSHIQDYAGAETSVSTRTLTQSSSLSQEDMEALPLSVEWTPEDDAGPSCREGSELWSNYTEAESTLSLFYKYD